MLLSGQNINYNSANKFKCPLNTGNPEVKGTKTQGLGSRDQHTTESKTTTREGLITLFLVKTFIWSWSSPEDLSDKQMPALSESIYSWSRGCHKVSLYVSKQAPVYMLILAPKRYVMVVMFSTMAVKDKLTPTLLRPQGSSLRFKSPTPRTNASGQACEECRMWFPNH